MRYARSSSYFRMHFEQKVVNSKKNVSIYEQKVKLYLFGLTNNLLFTDF